MYIFSHFQQQKYSIDKILIIFNNIQYNKKKLKTRWQMFKALLTIF